MDKIKVIAEIGSNHNGDVALAKKMIDVAVECGADAVKFQTFKSEALVSTYAPMASYQKNNLGVEESQLEMLRKLELSQSDYMKLFAYADFKGVEMFSTPFDIPSVDFLTGLGMKVIKIPSGEITNLPFLEHISQLPVQDKHIILSTGMASLEEIKAAVEVLGMNSSKMTILHCNTNYPSPDEDVNLRAIMQLHEIFPQYDIGLSDHTPGVVAPLIACGMDITMVEKHFTLSKDLPGPDHKMSLEPKDLRNLVQAIRRAELMLGGRHKVVTESEAPNRIWARKSIVAAKEIKAGQIFSEKNLTTKRPGTGISPMMWHKVIGKKAERDFEMDELISVTGIPTVEDNDM